MYTCNKCSKTFSSKQRLKYHTTNNVCNKYEKKFHCIFCSKKYKTKYTFLQHLNLKHSKKIVNKKLNTSQNLVNTSQKKENTSQKKENPQKKNDLECEYCNKVFTRKDNLNRHIKKYCKKVKTANITNNTTNNTTNNINTTNNTINNNCNNTYNITINNFGKESLESISDKDIFKCVNKCYNGIPALFKLIHIDTPENQNLYLTNIKNPYIYIYNDNKWILNELREILDYIQKEKKGIIEEYMEKNNNKFKKYKINNIKKMLEDYRNGNLEKRYNSKLKLLLINNKDILKKAYEGK